MRHFASAWAKYLELVHQTIFFSHVYNGLGTRLSLGLDTRLKMSQNADFHYM